MANTTFKGTVRAESGLKVSTQTAATGAYTDDFSVSSAGILTRRYPAILVDWDYISCPAPIVSNIAGEGGADGVMADGEVFSMLFPNTTGTTIGTNVVNVGSCVMAQSVVLDIIGADALNQRVAIVPANSQIVDVILNVTTVNNDSGTATVSIGTSADDNAFISLANVKALATTHGTLDTEATDVGTTDLEVFADFVAGTEDGSTGAATATVLYMQNNNLS